MNTDLRLKYLKILNDQFEKNKISKKIYKKEIKQLRKQNKTK